MKKNISVKEGNLDDVLLVHENIVEFDEKHPPKDFFIKRYENTKHIIIISYYNEFPLNGYMNIYDNDYYKYERRYTSVFAQDKNIDDDNNYYCKNHFIFPPLFSQL